MPTVCLGFRFKFSKGLGVCLNGLGLVRGCEFSLNPKACSGSVAIEYMQE